MTNPTMLQAVDTINQIAGKHPENSWDKLSAQVKLINEEFNKELIPAIEERNLGKVRDAIADVLVTTLGCGSVSTIPVEEDFFRVIDSLYSRFDTNPEDAEITLNKHRNSGISCETIVTEVNGVTRYVCKVTHACEDDKGNTYPVGKFLKAHGFHEPVLRPIEDLV